MSPAARRPASRWPRRPASPAHDPAAIAGFPQLDGRKNEVIVHRSQRNGYDYAIRQTGARLIEIGTLEATQRWELEAAISPQTACVVYFAGEHFARGALPLPEVIAIAHARGVPVLVDAAAQIPPIANLWRFTNELGADLAIFSGGKGLRGPQPSGLVLGRADLIAGMPGQRQPQQQHRPPDEGWQGGAAGHPGRGRVVAGAG